MCPVARNPKVGQAGRNAGVCPRWLHQRATGIGADQLLGETLSRPNEEVTLRNPVNSRQLRDLSLAKARCEEGLDGGGESIFSGERPTVEDTQVNDSCLPLRTGKPRFGGDRHYPGNAMTTQLRRRGRRAVTPGLSATEGSSSARS